MPSGSSPRLAVHRGSSRNSRPPGRAAPHRSAHAPLPPCKPHSLWTFFFSFPRLFFLGVANLCFLSSLFPFFFFFPFAAGGVGGRGSSLKSFKKKNPKNKNVLVQRLQLCAAGTARAGPPLSPAVPQQASLCPWSSGPVRRPGASLPGSGGSVTAPGCWLGSGSPLALMQRPPTSRRPATNQRLAAPL